MTPHTATPVRKPVLLAYALPAFVVALPTIPVYITLPIFYGVEMGVGLAATGGLLLISRVFDTVTDPVVGYLSDRFSLKSYRRKPWILLGAMIAGWGLNMLLSPPEGAGGAHLLIWSIVLYTGWTMISIPYLALGAELHTGYNERARITGWREALGLLGMMGAGALIAYVSETQSPATAPGMVAWSTILLGAVFIPILLWKVPERTPPRAIKPKEQRVKQLISLAQNKPFLNLLSTWFINGIANGIPAALFFMYLEYGLGVAAAERPRFILIYFLSAILAIPVWLYLSRKFGKHRAWCWAMILAVSAFIIVPALPTGAELLFMLICILTGAALGADLILPPAMQADVADYDLWRFNSDRLGLLFALWGMTTKLALAVAVGIALPAVQWLGFNPENPSETGRMVLIVIYAGIPAVIKVLAITIIWRFPLNANRQRALRRRLAIRGGGLNSGADG